MGIDPTKLANRAAAPAAKGTPGGAAFQYRPRNYDDVVARSQQSASGRNSFVKNSVKFFTPADKDNRIRLLPAGWPEPKHYGFDLWMHYGVGSDNEAYLCNAKHHNGDGRCPICELLPQATTDEEKGQLKPKHRVGIFLIDRSKEAEGPLLWAAPFNTDQDFLNASIDKFTHEVYPTDDPDSGYDLVFTKSGVGKMTRYGSVAAARSPSPLHSDPAVVASWLGYVTENNIPAVLQFFTYDHIKKVLYGNAAAPAEQAPAAAPARAPIQAPAARPAAPAPVAAPVQEEQVSYPKTLAEFDALNEDDVISLGVALKVDLTKFEGENAIEDLKAVLKQDLGLTQEAAPAPVPNNLAARFAKLKQQG
jgi:hypothetical protein